MSIPAAAASAFAILVAAASAAGEPLSEIQLLPMGPITARDGRKWLLADLAQAQAVVAASRALAGQTDLVIDYDHQGHFAAQPGVGGQAPAAGWITALEARDTGVWARVEWTAAAQAELRDRRYRYISPLFTHTPDGRVTRILNASLTNTPAIRELPAVASTLANPGDCMFPKAVLAALGLTEAATEAEVLAAIAGRDQAAAAAALAPTATALGLKSDAKAEEVAAAAATAVAGRADPTQFAPVALVRQLQAELTALTQGQAAAAASKAVEDAVCAGKLVPALKGWALAYASADLAGFQAFVAGAPTLVTGQRSAGAVGPSEPALTPELEAAASALGISHDSILAAAKAGL